MTGCTQRQAGASVLASIGLTLVLFLVALVAVNMVYMHYDLSRTIRERPELSLVPVPLPPAPPLVAAATPVSCYEVHFVRPWGRLQAKVCEFAEETTPSEGVALGRRTDGRELRAKGPEVNIDHQSRAENDDPADRGWTGRCFGDMTETRYDAMAKMLHYIPRRPGLFDVRQLLCQQVFIRWKDKALGPAPTAIYSFQTEHGRGFQIGDPAHSREIRVHFYDKEYDHHHCLVILAKPGAPPLTQSELDFILRSLRYADERDKAPAPTKGDPQPAKPAANPVLPSSAQAPNP